MVARTADLRKSTMMYFDEYAVDGLVNPKELAEVLQISEQSVKKYNSKQFTYDKEKKGLRRR